MTTQGLSDTDVNESKLFKQINAALENGDVLALDEALAGKPAAEAPATPETPAEAPAPEAPETPATPEPTQPSEPPATPETPEAPATPAAQPAAKGPTEAIDAALAALPEDQRKLIADQFKALNERFEHSSRSNSGRIAALQRKLDALEAQKRTPPPTKPAAEESRPTGKAAEKLAQLKESDPALAETLETLVAELRGDVEQRTTETQERLRKQEVEQVLRMEAEKLSKMYPPAFEIFGTPEWANWRDTQSQAMQTLAKSDYADDVMVALGKFAVDVPYLFSAQTTQPQQGEGTQPAAPAVPDPAAQKLAEARDKKLAGDNPSSARVPAAPVAPQDEKALYEKYLAAELQGYGIDTK